jgi:hypothetical protein
MPQSVVALMIAGAILATFGAAGLIAWELAEWMATRRDR